MAKFLMEKINQDVTLKIKNATKSFAGVTVLNNVSFDLYRGEVHSLLGENGAGKSTLIKILSGVHKPDQGKVILENKEFVFNSPKEAFKNGIATVYQELLVFPELTVAENIFLGHTPKTKIGLIVRAVGDSPESASNQGINVRFVRYACILYGGAM